MGIDGLAVRCRGTLAAEPRSGVLFVFINRSKTMIRTLAFDGNGFWLMTKRLSKGKFRGWPGSKEPLHPLGASHLRQLLAGDLYDPQWQKSDRFGSLKKVEINP
jgi:transposase